MLETMRKSSQSLLIYVLFGIVIAVFIINFGPQGGSGCDASSAPDHIAAKVAGHTVTVNDFRYGFMLRGGGRVSAKDAKSFRLKERAMDAFIERELFADEADRLGFRVGAEEVEDQIADGRFVGLGMPQALPVQKDGHFDYDAFKKFVQYDLGLTPKTFVEQQRRELLAFRLKEFLRGTVKVAPDEVKAEFVKKGNQVNLEYVRFSPSAYRDELALATDEIARWTGANEAKVKEKYEQSKYLYEKAPKSMRLRHVLVRLDPGASEAAQQAAEKKAQGFFDRATKDAKGKPGEALARIARESSDDLRSKARGGDLGWKRQGGTGLGPAVEDKVFAAKEGDLVGPLKGPEGYHVIAIEGAREGDIPFDKVKLEIGEDLLRADKAKAKAKAEAEAALARGRGETGKTLKDLFPPPADDKKEEGAPSLAPRAEETGLFARRGTVVESLGPAPELAKAAFTLKPDAPLAGPFEVGEAFVVVRLKEKKEPDMAEFEKQKASLTEQQELTKLNEVLADLAERQCLEAKERKRIEVNQDVLRYDEGPEQAVAYEPCTPPHRQ